MITPQDIQEISFDKAVFGGYDMQSVDDVLEPLTQDYLTLYKENAVLKSKMRLLVDKLEEYRANEESMKNAIVAAQKTSDEMVAAAEKKCAALIAEAEAGARSKSRDIDAAIGSEVERLNRAKDTAADFIAAIETDINRHLEQLEQLKQLDLSKQPAVQTAPHKVYDFEAEQQAPAKDADVIASKIANEIEQSVEKIMGGDLTPADLGTTKIMPAVSADAHKEDKYSNLQFGRNYDPTK